MKRIGWIRRYWHRIRFQYLRMLYDSCLDEDMREKLRSKMEYHKKHI